MTHSAAPDRIHPYRRKPRPLKGELRHKKRRMMINFSEELFGQIVKEANGRGWPFSRMVVFLCEASIEGIE